MQWPKDPGALPRPNLIYRIIRSFARTISLLWFREIDIVDEENIPQDGGVVFIAWHPSGLIDPMLMVSSLPGQISTIAKHTLFKIPLLGRLIKAGGALPIMRSKDSDDNNSKNHNSNQLASVAKAVSEGGRLIIFPEGGTHSASESKRVRTGAARIIQSAIILAGKNNFPPPLLIPIGLHYSDAHVFRERAAVIIEKPMTLPPLPSSVDNENINEEPARDWVRDVTNDIDCELQRASHSTISWQKKHLIWRARSIVYAERSRAKNDKITKPAYSEAVLGARRIRAGWEFLANNHPEKIVEIEKDAISHFETLDEYGLHPLDIDVKPENPKTREYLLHVIKWVWASCWMLGAVTWGAIIGNLPPYYFNRLLVKLAKNKGAEREVIGTIKVYSSFILFPLWWIFISFTTTWLIVSENSPLFELFSKHWALELLGQSPPLVAFLVLLIWWPISGRANLVLHANATKSWRILKRWRRWNDSSIAWSELRAKQLSIASSLASIGDNLILPGDKEWTNPPTGVDDYNVVKYRDVPN